MWHSCLRHCASSRKVAGTIPGGVVCIFHGLNLSGRAMTLWFQKYLLGGKGGGEGGRWVVLTTLPPSCADCLEILEASTSWSPLRLSSRVMG